MKRRWMKPVENGQTGNARRKLSTRPAQEPQLRDVKLRPLVPLRVSAERCPQPLEKTRIVRKGFPCGSHNLAFYDLWSLR